MAESRIETNESTNTDASKKPVTVVAQHRKQLSDKPLPPAPDAEPAIPETVIPINAQKTEAKLMARVPAKLVNGAKQTNGEEQSPDGKVGLQKSHTTIKPQPPKAKPVFAKKEAPKAEAPKAAEASQGPTDGKIDPHSQYLLTYGDETEEQSRFAKLKPKCKYVLKEMAIAFDPTVLKPLDAFPAGYMFSELDLFKKNPVVNPGFAGYAIHNLLEILAEHKKDDLKSSVKNKAKLKHLAFVGSAGLITSALTQHYFPIQYDSVGEKSLSVALPGAVMGLANHAYDRYFSSAEPMPRNYLTHFAQKVIMVGLNTVQAVGFTMCFHELANEFKYQNNDASAIFFSRCVLLGLSSMTALKLFDLARFKFYLTPKEQAQEIHDKGGKKRIMFPEGLGYVLMGLSYVIANSIETMNFSWDTNHSFINSTEEVAAKTAKLMAIYGTFRLGSEWYLDRERRKMLERDGEVVDAHTSLITGGDLEANRATAANRRASFDDEEPVTSGYEPPSSAHSVNRGGK